MSGDPVNRGHHYKKNHHIIMYQNHSRLYPELQARIEEHEAARFIDQSIIAALLLVIIISMVIIVVNI